MRVLVPLILLFLLCLFVAGAVVPRRSRRMQGWVDDRLERAEDRSDRRWGRVGDGTAKALNLFRRATDRSAQAGRKTHDKLSP